MVKVIRQVFYVIPFPLFGLYTTVRHQSATSAAFSFHKVKFIKKTEQSELCSEVVLVTGVEPVRCHHRWILSPVRLPIPSHQPMIF